MKILATVSIHGQPVTQPWEFVAGDPEPAIVLSELTDKRILGIPLDPDQIAELPGNAGVQQRYLGNLDLTQAMLLPAVG